MEQQMQTNDSCAFPNIEELRNEHIFKWNYNEKRMKRIHDLIEKVTEEEIIAEGEKHCGHPFMHEFCEQWPSSFPLLEAVWKSEVFRKFWENNDYTDKYGNNVLQRLSFSLSRELGPNGEAYTKISAQRIKWIEENMGVIPTRQNGHANPIGPYKKSN
jgi:hypothetical protein